MAGRVLLAATKKLAQVADSLCGSAMCHDLALATPEALSQAASSATQKAMEPSVFRHATDRLSTLDSEAVKGLSTEPAAYSTEPLLAVKQRSG